MRSDPQGRARSRRARLLAASALKYSRKLRLVGSYLRAHDRHEQPQPMDKAPNTGDSRRR